MIKFIKMNFSQISFVYGQIFYLFPVLIIGILVKEFLKNKSKTGVEFPILKDFKKIKGGNFRVFLSRFLPPFLWSLIFLLILILIARPQYSLEKKKIKKKGIDMVFLLDVSTSMLAEDLEPNRIEKAKDVIDSFLSKIEEDRVGIVVFSGIPFTQVPLTFDYATLRNHLKNISTESISEKIGGTQIGDAIIAATDIFSKEGGDKEKREKVMILITDGEQTKKGVKPDFAAKYAAENDIKIYTIGIGKPGGAPVIYYDEFGRERVDRDVFGNIRYTKLDEKTLKEIANLANGMYFRATDNKTLERIFEELGKLTKKEIEVESYIEHKDVIFPFAIALFFLIPLEFLLRKTYLRVIK